MTYRDVAIKVLENSNEPLTTKEIWEKACELGLDKEIIKFNKEKNPNYKITGTPCKSIDSIITRDIQNNLENSTFIRVGRCKFLRDKEALITNVIENIILEEEKKEEVEKIEIKLNTNTKVKEADLHTPLSKYLHTMKIYTKTINANSISTQQKGKMKWGTPDIIGVTFREDVNTNILELFNNINLPTVEIYAYELKLELTMSNLVEYYFQAVSNSSWANEAWLVAMEIDIDDTELMEEIKRLNQAFGVGLIYLNYISPEDSEIIVSAKKRNYLDIDTMNKLSINNDFNNFVYSINQILMSNNNDTKAKLIKSFINDGTFNKIN